jgi:hypothetical protein
MATHDRGAFEPPLHRVETATSVAVTAIHATPASLEQVLFGLAERNLPLVDTDTETVETDTMRRVP